MHVDADQLQAVAAHDRHGFGDVIDPDAVLALRAAGVGLVAVAMAETGVDTQPDAVPARGLAYALQHVQRTRVDGRR
ncbi:hypothetical protein G6F31_021666 [Rhizopus arrhizus]|nr:hypothetical protein G6F31_021666 [Rhizopus arrhizus]